MNKYTVTYNGKFYTQRAENAEDAIEKLANRRVFGSRFIFDYHISLIDADTRGKEWAEAWTRQDTGSRRIFAQKNSPPELRPLTSTESDGQ